MLALALESVLALEVVLELELAQALVPEWGRMLQEQAELLQVKFLK